MSGRTLLLWDKELAAWWVSVSHDHRFQQVITLARADMSETVSSVEHLQGANAMLNLLQTFSDGDDSFVPFPSPGLIHRIPVKHTEPKKEESHA
jgi:hypothetical protein